MGMGQPPAQDSLTRRPPPQPADEPLSPGSHHPAPIPAPDPPISHPNSLINLPDPLLQNACQDTPSEEPQGQFEYFSPVTSKHTWPPVTVLPGASVPVFHVRQPSTHVNALPTQPLPVPELPLSGTVLGDQQNKTFILEDTVHQNRLQPSAEEKISGLTAASASAPIPVHAPPLRSQLSTMSFTSQHSLSPASAISSPSLAAMADLTPLPSPLLPEDSPGPWRQNHARPGSAGSLRSLSENVQVEDFNAAPSTTPATSRALSTKRKKTYSSLMPSAVEGSSSARKYEPGHVRNRSLSELVPEAVHNVRPRNSTLSGLPRPDETPIEQPLQREEYLAEQRGLVQPQNNPRSQTHADTPASLPTPPPSNRSVTESEGDELMREEEHYTPNLTVRDQKTGQKTYYRPIRPLGQGTFSKVVLATSQALPGNFPLNEHSESSLDPKQLVAIKIVGHGPAGGADEERVELSLKREIEIMKTISHPSLIHLKAYDFNDDETLLVLGYCAGGDLFDLASQSRDALTPGMVQRIFAELVDAVKYLHSLWIVHRDIKLENVLVNIPSEKLLTISSPQTHPVPLITLTDLGLSRSIPQPPQSPLLTTRCGSEDYAAPEILLSQPYDGRATDAWALGVLLYALMEGRLPFDPPPPRPGAKVSRSRGRAAHRIARCDWIWSRFGDVDGEWDAELGKGWEGGRDVVDGLLRKVNKGRWSIDQVHGFEWVRNGIDVPGSLEA